MRVFLPYLIAVLCLAGAPSKPAHGQTDSAAEVDRELVVRFTRAYGMAKEALGEHAQDVRSEQERKDMLSQPDELDRSLRREVNRILDLNGLQQDEWELMFARMEADEDLRRRVESLSTPFEASQNR